MSFSKSPELLIFDCDGVLVDSELIATRVHIEALAKCGYIISAEEYNDRFIGMTDQQSYSVIESEGGLRLPEDHHERVMAEVANRYARDLRATSGVRQTLEAINLRKCVASNSDAAKLSLALKVTDLHDFFWPHVFSASQVARGKPAPDLFLFAAQNMNTPAGSCLVIEDSVAGTQAAVAAGMMVIGFVGGSHCLAGHGDKLMEAGATKLFSRMTALPQILAAL
ncbi:MULTISPECIES: HAD family hydrolase [Rhizobium]|uniref:HAD family hydrolase n=1 Tax=Rhizobium TaxID=379 RepID=UPI0013E00FB6|nr:MULTISPECIES: HAD family hydrolase [Rhizobium]NEJ95469.1 HAD-IA family hydrolase [Rhizobium ruizarguesonis]NKJ78319.1 HAD-IA family hydrolase [Rhizobium leguminosarum bv. viciae]